MKLGSPRAPLLSYLRVFVWATTLGVLAVDVRTVRQRCMCLRLLPRGPCVLTHPCLSMVYYVQAQPSGLRGADASTNQLTNQPTSQQLPRRAAVSTNQPTNQAPSGAAVSTNQPTQQAPSGADVPTNQPTGESNTNSVALALTSTSTDAFTIIFVSDMETEYRGHTTEWCKKIVEYIKNLSSLNLKYDGDHPIDPALVIHGGDISDGTFGTWSQRSTDASDSLFNDVWQQLYDAGIPMISALGNHDSDGFSSQIKQQANKFVLDSYTKTKALVPDFSYTEIIPQKADGQSLFTATFRGVQIANLNDYRDNSDAAQLTQFSNTLASSKTTLFVSHYPMSYFDVTDPALNLVSKFSGSAVFTGHTHVKEMTNYSTFVDYTAAYPHPLERPGTLWTLGETCYLVLASSTSSILLT